VEVVEVNPEGTSTIGMLKYAPALSLSKDAAALVIGRRALGFEEGLPKGYEALLLDEGFGAHARSFYEARIPDLQARKDAEAQALLRPWEGPRRPEPRLKPSWLSRGPEGANRWKEPPRRQSLAGPEGRHLSSPSSGG